MRKVTLKSDRSNSNPINAIFRQWGTMATDKGVVTTAIIELPNGKVMHFTPEVVTFIKEQVQEQVQEQEQVQLCKDCRYNDDLRYNFPCIACYREGNKRTYWNKVGTLNQYLFTAVDNKQSIQYEPHSGKINITCGFIKKNIDINKITQFNEELKTLIEKYTIKENTI